ncbi:MAG: hypothetical protein LBR85_04425 [Oscillospiraceae bacterium]|nr:hypothetical protein [Oscillospiraceae bacterium]
MEHIIYDFKSFVAALQSAGFSVASGGNDEGVFGLIKHGWDDDPGDSPVRWHTGDPDTDPWEWRMRVLDERDDIAYAKMFFRKGGYITREWYPYFLAARRGARGFDEEYADGAYSRECKRVYDVLRQSGALPLEEIKARALFTKEDKSRFDRALTDLQTGLFVTISGRRHKLSQTGEEYGWASAMYCTAEDFWPSEVFAQAAKISAEDAQSAITARVYALNPNANAKKVVKFIFGR